MWSRRFSVPQLVLGLETREKRIRLSVTFAFSLSIILPKFVPSHWDSPKVLSCASCIYNLNEGWETICCQGCESRRSFFRTNKHAPIKMGRESTCHDLCSMSATLWWKYHSRTKYILWSSSGAVTAENLSFRNLKFRVKSLHMRADYMRAFQTRSFMLCFFGCVSAVDALQMDNGHASS